VSVQLSLLELFIELDLFNYSKPIWEQGTGDREQGTGDREQGTGNREEVTGKR